MSRYRYKLEISTTEMEAFLTINRTEEDFIIDEEESSEEYPNAAQIIRYLRMSSVKYGVNRKIIEKMVRDKKVGETIQVAKGLKPEKGNDGTVEYYFPIQSGGSSFVDEIGSNFFDLNRRSRQVCKGDLLAKLIPPGRGGEGITVTGRRVTLTKGGEVYIRAGRNVIFGDPEQRELRAGINGIVSLQGGTIHVDGTYLVEKDADASVGDIEFPGSVVVLGDVKDSVFIRAGGNIEVKGDVGDNSLEAEGDVIVKGHFAGEGRGFIRAGGDVYLKLLKNQKVQAAGSVKIRESCIGAEVTAGESIALTLHDSQASGGRLQAGWNVIAPILGDDKHTPISLSVKAHEHFRENLQEIEKKVSELYQELQSLDQGIKKLQNYQSPNRLNNSKVTEKLRALMEKKPGLQAQLKEALQKRNAIQGKRNRLGDPGMVLAPSKVYPGVQIRIGEAQYLVVEMQRQATFRLQGGEIVQAQKVYSATIQ